MRQQFQKLLLQARDLRPGNVPVDLDPLQPAPEPRQVA